MEYLHNGFTLTLCDGAFPFSTDSVALANFVKLPGQAKVLDLGSGCGTLGLMLCADHDDCHVTGIELSQADHLCALQNAERNGISHRFTSICADLRTIHDIFPAGAFHVCVSNPPYFTDGLKSPIHARSRHADQCPPEALFRSAQWALKYGGDFFLVQKPDMLAALCHHAVCHQLEPKHLMLLRHREDSPVSLILLHCRKGAKPGLKLREAALHHADGTPTDYYNAIYHL